MLLQTASQAAVVREECLNLDIWRCCFCWLSRPLNSEEFDDPLSFNGISRGLSLTGKLSCVLVRYLGCEELASPRDLDDRF